MYVEEIILLCITNKRNTCSYIGVLLEWNSNFRIQLLVDDNDMPQTKNNYHYFFYTMIWYITIFMIVWWSNFTLRIFYNNVLYLSASLCGDYFDSKQSPGLIICTQKCRYPICGSWILPYRVSKCRVCALSCYYSDVFPCQECSVKKGVSSYVFFNRFSGNTSNFDASNLVHGVYYKKNKK